MEENKLTWRVIGLSVVALMIAFSFYVSVVNYSVDKQTKVNTQNIQTIVDFINQSIQAQKK